MFSHKCDTILQDGSKTADAPYSNVLSFHKPMHQKYHQVSASNDDEG